MSAATDIFSEHDGMIAVNLDGGEVESADELHSGNRVTKEGMYHVNAVSCTLQKADVDKKKLPCLDIELQVLNGSDTDGNELIDQVDKVISHRIYLANWENKESGEMKGLDDRAQKGVRAFAYAFGLISDAELGKKGVSVPFHMIEGRQAVVRVKRDGDWTDSKGAKRQGGLKIAWNNDTWPVDHDYVKDVHKNREALALVADMSAAGGGASDSDLNDI